MLQKLLWELDDKHAIGIDFTATSAVCPAASSVIVLSVTQLRALQQPTIIVTVDQVDYTLTGYAYLSTLDEDCEREDIRVSDSNGLYYVPWMDFSGDKIERGEYKAILPRSYVRVSPPCTFYLESENRNCKNRTKHASKKCWRHR